MKFRRPSERAWVRVGAAATEATILVNGQVAATHLGAWTPFEVDITRFRIVVFLNGFKHSDEKPFLRKRLLEISIHF